MGPKHRQNNVQTPSACVSRDLRPKFPQKITSPLCGGCQGGSRAPVAPRCLEPCCPSQATNKAKDSPHVDSLQGPTLHLARGSETVKSQLKWPCTEGVSKDPIKERCEGALLLKPAHSLKPYPQTTNTAKDRPHLRSLYAQVFHLTCGLVLP